MEAFLNELRAFTEAFQQEQPAVLGDGVCDARVMLIGEAPGEKETLEGRPFVGKAGKNLDAFLQLAGIDRKELYVSNVVKFRPTKRSKAGGIVNRPPTKKEIDAFRPWLLKEIELVNPEVVVILGNVPLQAVAGDKRVISDWHGRFIDISGRRLYPMYHPAAIIYNRSLSAVYEADVIALGEALRENLQKNPSNSDLN